MRPVTERFERALQLLDEHRLAECRAELNRITHGMPRVLDAEADHIRARSLIAERSAAAREEAEALLKEWDGLETLEPELGIRMLHLRLYASTLVVDREPRREMLARLRNVLRVRSEYDHSAVDAWFRLDRAAGSYSTPDAGLDLVAKAVDHFKPAPGQTVTRRPIEHYKCLVNLGAKHLTNAQYEEARHTYGRVAEFVDEYVPGTFPRLDYARSGAVLADFRLGLIDAAEAAARQREIIGEVVIDDAFYAVNALAVYLVLAGDIDEALHIFDGLDEQLESRQRPEPSMLYLVRANRCASRYVAGVAGAAAEWAELARLVTQIPYLIRDYLIPRHEMLSEIMQRGEATSPVAFDECLLGSTRFGPLWDQVGRGFRMPEVEWWS
jgi:tetratricopeptide (TPR) repeat protein